MKKKFWDKRLPSLLGLLFLAISMGITAWFSRNYTELYGKASGGLTPMNVQISNITDTSFNVSYITADPVTGLIAYGSNGKFGQVELDDRDKKLQKPSTRQVHYITISHLNPDTRYYFRIQSGGSNFLNNNKLYDVTTAKFATASAVPSVNQTSVAGSVNLPNGNIPDEGIVYVSAPTSQLLSTLLGTNGTYLIPLRSLLSSNLESYALITNDTILQLVIRNGIDVSHVSVKVADANTIPLVTLSKDYNFTIDTSFTNYVASESATASPSKSPFPITTSGFPSFPSQGSQTPDVLTPKNAEKFTDTQPLFKGTALPNMRVDITIESPQKIQTTVTANSFGDWQFRPTAPLSPGQHTITILTRDASGIQQIIKRSFTVFAQGSRFTEPSVSPTFTPTPTASSSPSPTTPPVLPTLTPLPTSPTPTVPAPTVLQTLTPAVSPTPTLLPLKPPGSSSLLIAGALATLSLATGFVVFFFL